MQVAKKQNASGNGPAEVEVRVDRPLWRRFAFGVCLLVAVWVVLEVATYVLYPFVSGKSLAMAELQRQRVQIISRAASPARVLPEAGVRQDVDVLPFTEVVHPYLGFVQDPVRTPGVSAYGLHAMPPFGPPPTNTLVIGIFGGSFADQLASSGKQALIEALRADERYRDRAFQIVSMSLNGYKQPQQLIALSYFLALGCHFDMIVHVDGFNEVALPTAENLPQGVFPFFPRGWFARMYNYADAGTVLRVADLLRQRQRQQVVAGVFAAWPLRGSPVANAVWVGLQARLARRTVASELDFQRLLREQVERPGYQVTGPAFRFENEAELYAGLASFWARCALQMHQLCAANGIAYYHFLQPNQYVTGSKPMSAEERRVAILAESPFREGAAAGYPHLVRMGQELRRQGVHFEDLTMLFHEMPEILYRDNCCHLNERGYALTATAIGAFMTQAR